MKEIWKDIKGYEGLYQVSNLGNVKSLDAIINCEGAKGIKCHLRKGRILKKAINNKGYYYVNLSKNSKVKNIKIHKIVANTFINNSNNYNCVNHIDGNKLNNFVENLEWCSYSHNNKEAYRLNLKKPVWKGKINKEHPLSKEVYQYDLRGNFIKKWDNANDVKRKLGICAENIRSCCNGKKKTCNNYIWKYGEEHQHIGEMFKS